MSLDHFQTLYGDVRAKDVRDELARRAVENGSFLPDPWFQLRDHAPDLGDVGPPSRTMDEWLGASPVELLDGPLVLGGDDEFDDWHDHWEDR